MPDLNRQIVLKSRPEGEPGLDNFALTRAAIPEPGDGEVLMRTLYLSLDPYMRGRMSARRQVGQARAGGEIGQPKPGETVVVAAASGAVGSMVGQIAKIKDCCAVGIVGGTEKCRYVTGTLGFDTRVDHREPDFSESLAAACPVGIDIYFENVSGAMQQTVWPLLNEFARSRVRSHRPIQVAGVAAL